MTSSSPRLYIILIILVGVAGGYIVYSQWVKPFEEVVPPPIVNTKDSLSTFQNLKIDFSSLDSKGLFVSGESPVNPGPTGKTDLFAP